MVPPSKVLVVGADGTIGGALLSVLRGMGVDAIGTTRRFLATDSTLIPFNLGDAVAARRLAEKAFSTVIICAGVSSVNACELDPCGTRQINVVGIVGLASIFVRFGAHVVFLSSNMVFDGSVPYVTRMAPHSPRTEYGRQKADAEKLLIQLLGDVSIIRLGKVIGSRSQIFDSWCDALSSGQTISPCANKYMAPVAVDVAVSMIVRVVRLRFVGLLQLSATHDISYSSAGSLIATGLGFRLNMVREVFCTEEDCGPLPLHTTLATDGIEALGLLAPPAEQALDYYVGRRLGSKEEQKSKF